VKWTIIISIDQIKKVYDNKLHKPCVRLHLIVWLPFLL